MALRRFGNDVTNLFALLGRDENSATFALGWALDRCATFRDLFAVEMFGHSPERMNEVTFDLQRHDEAGGFTDIEVASAGFCHFVIEAKRGWAIPSVEQLEVYARRLANSSGIDRLIVSISAATYDYAMHHLPKDISGVPVSHRSWLDISRVAEAARRKATGYEEKLWLWHLRRHLEDFVSMQDPRDNMVYVVSLSARPIHDGNPYTWIDAVEQDGVYFHPVGNGRNTWPVFPPNYIGFRHHGELQSVCHIDSYKVVSNLFEQNPQWPNTDTDQFIYQLGPKMKPACPVRTGNIYRNGKVWCAIDTLLSGVCETVRDARDETRLRLQRAEAAEPL